MLASAAPVTRCFGRSTNRPVIPGGRSFLLPALMHDPRALPQRDPRPWTVVAADLDPKSGGDPESASFGGPLPH
jgi:hypothetical protein